MAVACSPAAPSRARSTPNSLTLWDLDARERLASFAGHDWPIDAVAVTDDGHAVILAANDEVADLLDERRVGRPHWNAIRLIPGGRRRALTASNGGDLALWSLETGAQEVVWRACSLGITDLAVRADARLAATASGTPYYASDNTLRIWDLETREVTARFVGESPFVSCAFCPDGVTVVAGDEAGRVHFLRLEAAKSVGL